MGAETFMQFGSGDFPKEAFQSARSEAQYQYGHAGYTGSLAEKDSFVEIKIPADFQPELAPQVRATRYADVLIDEDDPRISDKWGPAGCIHVENDSYLFFGWASS